MSEGRRRKKSSRAIERRRTAKHTWCARSTHAQKCCGREGGWRSERAMEGGWRVSEGHGRSGDGGQRSRTWRCAMPSSLIRLSCWPIEVAIINSISTKRAVCAPRAAEGRRRGQGRRRSVAAKEGANEGHIWAGDRKWKGTEGAGDRTCTGGRSQPPSSCSVWWQLVWPYGSSLRLTSRRPTMARAGTYLSEGRGR